MVPMKKIKGVEWFFEFLWLIFAALASYLICYSMVSVIKPEYLIPVLLFCFLSLSYFRIILFTKENPYIKHIVLRILFFIVNVPLFFTIVIYLQDFYYLFDHFNIEQFMLPDLTIMAEEGLEIYKTFRTVLVASAVSSLLLILILEFKLVQYILLYFR